MLLLDGEEEEEEEALVASDRVRKMAAGRLVFFWCVIFGSFALRCVCVSSRSLFRCVVSGCVFNLH